MLGRYVRQNRRRIKHLCFWAVLTLVAATTCILLKMDQVGFIDLGEIFGAR